MSAQKFIALIKRRPLCSVCVALSLVLAVGIYLRGGALPDLQATYQADSAEGEKIFANKTNAAMLPDQLAALKADDQSIAARLVHGDDLATNLQYFYRLEAETGVKLVDLRQLSLSPRRKGVPKTAYTGVGFAVTVQGDYRQLLVFLRKLETGVYFCRINAATCNRADGDRGTGDQITLNLNLELLGRP